MTKKRVIEIMAIIETISIIVVFGISFFIFNNELLMSIILSLIISLISGLSTYSYLVRAYGLDVRPWKK